MAEFQYKAKDSQGRAKQGSIKANNISDAKSRLMKMRYKSIYIASSNDKKSSQQDNDAATKRYLGGILEITENGRININLMGEPKPKTKDLIIYTKQLATMLGSGVSLVQSIDILSKTQRVPSMGRTLRNVKVLIENGLRYSDALSQHPKVFNQLYTAMIRAGEESGKLPDIMMKLVNYIEKTEKMKTQVKSAMMYPAIVLVVAIGVVIGMLVFLVPTFAAQFTEGGKPLPALTQYVVDLSNSLQSSWMILIGTLTALAFALNRYKATEKGARDLDALALKAPIVGDLVRKVSIGRFCSTLSTMLSSGVNVIQALTICSNTSGNRVISEFVILVRNKVEQGQFLSHPLAENPLFPAMVVSMIQVGEKSGRLDEMLLKITEFYEDEVDVALKTMISMIEPIMIVSIGGIIAFLVIAMYMPVFDMAGNIG